MATVSELKAKFSAEIAGMQRAFKKLRDETAKIGPETEKAVKKASKSYDGLVASTDKLDKALKDIDGEESMKDLGDALRDVQDELRDTGKVSAETMEKFKKEVRDADDFLDTFGQSATDNFDELEEAVKDTAKELDKLGDSDLDKVAKDTDKAEKGLRDVEDSAEDAAKEVDDLDKEFDGMGKNAQKETSTAEDAINKLGGTLKTLGGVVAGAFALDKIKDFMLYTVETTAELEAVRDQYEQVMGAMVDDTDKYLSQMAEEWNKHPNEIQNTLMQYVAILKGKGIEEEQAHKIARDYLERTVDANAFANESMADTTARFMGMIKGEYSSVDTAMVNVNATMLDTKAQEEYGKKFAELSAEQQELLKTQEALRQHTSAGVIGQGAREADSYANNVAMLKNTWDDFLATYGGPLMGAANEGLKFAVNMVENLDGAIDKAKDTFKPFAEGIRNLFDTFDTGEGGNILERMGLTADSFKPVLTFIATLQENLSRMWDVAWPILKRLGTAIGETLVDIWPFVQDAIGTAVDFIGGMIEKIVSFWESDGKQFADAVGNVFNGILAVVKFVWPLVFGIIKTVWNNIKGVIEGGLSVIMGLVKVFTGLFTGDFSKMWQGVKDIFFGAVQFIWNWIQLMFFGRIIKGVGVFAKSMGKGFKTMWTGIKTAFTGGVTAAWQTIRSGWSTIWNATKNLFSNMWNFIKDTWNSIRSLTTGAINGVRTIVTAGWNRIRSITTSTFTNIWNAIRGVFTSIWNFIRTTVGNIGKRITDTWNTLKNSTSTTFKNIYDGIVKRFNDIVNAAKALPKKIGDGIGSMANKVTAGVTKVVNKLASTLGKGVNGVIGGINWVLGKIGVDSEIPKWTVPQYARGTDGHPGGLAVVGDGKGSLRGPELIQTPDGETYLSPDKDTLVNMPRGTQVLNAKDTKKILYPHYEEGIGSGIKKLGSDFWEGAKRVGKKVADTALNVFDYVKNPGKLLDLALKGLGVEKPSGSGFVGDMARGAWNKVKGGAVDYLKGMLEKASSFTGGKFGSPFRLTSRAGWRNHPILGRPMFHYGDDYAAPAGTPIPSQSGGVVTQAGYHSIRGNYVRVKSGIYELLYQHLANLFVRPGQSVSKGTTLGTVGSTGRSTGPHLHFETWKNGQFVPPVSLGYEDGGIVTRKQLAWIAEGGWAESVISHDPAKRLSQQAIWEQTGRELGFLNSEDNEEAIGLLMRIAQAVERGMDLSVILNDREVGRIIEPVVTEFQKRRERRERRFDTGVENV